MNSRLNKEKKDKRIPPLSQLPNLWRDRRKVMSVKHYILKGIYKRITVGCIKRYDTEVKTSWVLCKIKGKKKETTVFNKS